MQEDCPDAPNSKLLIGMGLSCLFHDVRKSRETIDEISDEFCDEFGPCASQKHMFTLMLQNRPDEFSDKFQTHWGQRAEVSRECLEPFDGELLI